jgi:hypothetical protein
LCVGVGNRAEAGTDERDDNSEAELRDARHPAASNAEPMVFDVRNLGKVQPRRRETPDNDPDSS